MFRRENVIMRNVFRKEIFEKSGTFPKKSHFWSMAPHTGLEIGINSHLHGNIGTLTINIEKIEINIAISQYYLQYFIVML